jgi:hypothetical protein
MFEYDGVLGGRKLERGAVCCHLCCNDDVSSEEPHLQTPAARVLIQAECGIHAWMPSEHASAEGSSVRSRGVIRMVAPMDIKAKMFTSSKRAKSLPPSRES